ncbi:uncharacterized protein DUF1376 [Rhizobium sp. PP-F2F-G38]|nr:uncharacterized protein DUF1376 [Rhizobium sp. PP-F2F-G38]
MEMDIDVRCLPYMPLQIEQLRKSKTWLRCRRQPELGFHLMNLWMRAWHEVPAGSIEDDDDILADAAMCSPEAWERLRPILLQGWEAIDGRLYHRTVTELATEGFGKLRKNKQRTEAARRAAEERRVSAQSEDAENHVTEPVTENVTDTVTAPEGKGREENTIIPSSRAKRMMSNEGLQKEFEESFWPQYPRKVDKKDALKAFVKARGEAPLESILTELTAFKRETAGKEPQFIRHAARWLNAQIWKDATPSPVADDERWAVRLKAARAKGEWSVNEWGPMPGQPGCRVPIDLLHAGDGEGWGEWEQAA